MKSKKQNRPTTIFFLLGISLSLGFFTGCNTMEGIGEDVERAGEEIEEAAE